MGYAMQVIPVEFLFPLPLPGPVFLEVQGVRSRLPLAFNGQVWSITVDLAEGVYLYRFWVDDLVCVGDARRSTQKLVDGERWSVVHLTSGGPVWIERSYPRLTAMELCQGITEAAIPLLVLDRLTPTDAPFVLWLLANHVYQDAALQLFLLGPKGHLVFGGEFWLESAKAAPDFSVRFWLSVDFEPDNLIEGEWTFLTKIEGSPIACKRFRLEVPQEIGQSVTKPKTGGM